MTLLRWLTFLLGSQIVILIVLLFWIYFFLLMLVFVLPWFSLHWEILTMLLFWSSNCCKMILEAAKLAYANKTKESISSQKLGSHNFWWTANSVLNRGKSAVPPLFSGPEVLSSASDKAKLFAENFSKNSNLDGSHISLFVFLSRSNLKLHNISVTPKMIKKVIMNPDLSKASGSDWIPVVTTKWVI